MLATSVTGRQRRVTGALGFTLIELLTVMAIMVLLTAAMPVALNRLLPARRVIATADQLVGDIRRLQADAIATGQIARLELGEGTYRTLIGERGVREVQLPSTLHAHMQSPADNRAVSQLIVYPDGTTSAVRIVLADSGRTSIVEVTMVSGRARRTG
jgi:prepilin-type N-terminal cleavage/methylation domain-containing protein